MLKCTLCYDSMDGNSEEQEHYVKEHHKDIKRKNTSIKCSYINCMKIEGDKCSQFCFFYKNCLIFENNWQILGSGVGRLYWRLLGHPVEALSIVWFIFCCDECTDNRYIDRSFNGLSTGCPKKVSLFKSFWLTKWHFFWDTLYIQIIRSSKSSCMITEAQDILRNILTL